MKKRYDRRVIFLLSFFVIFCFFITAKVFANSDSSSASATLEITASPSPVSPQDVSTLTSTLERLNDAPQKDETKIEQVASERKELLLDEVATSPATFLKKTTLTEEKETFPSRVQSDIEQKVETQGKLLVVHLDGKNKFKTAYKLISSKDKKVYHLHFSKKMPELETGTTVTVKGVQLDNHVAVEATGDTNTLTVNAPAYVGMNTSGEEKTAVLLVNFSNDSSQPISKTQIEQMLFTNSDSVNTYYKQNSYNKTFLSGKAFGWFTLSQTNDDCENNFYNWSLEADQKAHAAGFNLSSYQRIVYIFPPIYSCSWAGLGTIGGVPAQSWILQSFDEKRVYEHEFGHNLGLHHANSLFCENKSLDAYDKCWNVEYGDHFDVMGNFWPVSPASFQFNAPHKIALGWIPQTNVKTVHTTGSFTFRIYHTESLGSQVQAVAITKPDTQEYYYLSYRQPLGLDELLPLGMTRGASIHIWNNDAGIQTKLIDTTPGNDSWSGFDDASLSDGRKFSDKKNQIEITQKSHTKDYVEVSVKIGKEFDDVPPTVTITYPTVSSGVPKSKNITLTATASDNKGVAKVEFYKNGNLVCTDNKASYTCVSYTESVKGKQIVFEAKAYDTTGNTATYQVITTVK